MNHKKSGPVCKDLVADHAGCMSTRPKKSKDPKNQPLSLVNFGYF